MEQLIILLQHTIVIFAVLPLYLVSTISPLIARIVGKGTTTKRVVVYLRMFSSLFLRWRY